MDKKHSKLIMVIQYWLIPGVVITLLSGLIYLTGQQNLRMGANDPQIQIAENLAEALGQGQPAESLIPSNANVDLSKSLASFVIIFDDSGNPLVSMAQLDGKSPALPLGVFDYVKKNGEDRVTWQPKPGVRIAAVVTPYNGAKSGFVLAGRSLREVEIRESQLLLQVVAVWLFSLVVVFVMLMLFFMKKAKTESAK